MLALIPLGVAFFGLIVISTKKAHAPKVGNVLQNASILALKEIKEKEGYELTVYNDTLGNPTVGYGHLVLEADNLEVGDTITEQQANEFLEKDYKKAFNAAIAQAKELNKYDAELIAALTSVNYQLGTKWRDKFTNTWNMIKIGDVGSAINKLENSKWNSQTPVRVQAFINALTKTYS